MRPTWLDRAKPIGWLLLAGLLYWLCYERGPAR